MALVPYDDRDGWIWWNGSFLPWRDARLHVLSHGLHYASAVFEGERAYGGHIFKLRAHSERLIASGRILGFEIPYGVEAIDAACQATLAKNGLTDAYVRPIAWRGAEELGVAAQATTINLAIAVWEWGAYFGVEQRMKGVKLAMAPWRRPDPRTAPTASKATGLYMTGTISKHAAMDQGCDDALMLDWKGDVAEATGANIFFVAEGRLHTPTPICFLDGITRRTVMGLARERQIQVVERTITESELGGFGEAFLAGTAAEVTPIRQIGEHVLTPGQITETLMRDYETVVRQAPETVAQRGV